MFGLQLLNRVTERILTNPDRPDYRRLNINADGMKKHIMPRKGTVEFLQMVCSPQSLLRCCRLTNPL